MQSRIVVDVTHSKVFLFEQPCCIFRFMVDTDVVGCCWIELPKGKYRVREEKDTLVTDSKNPGKVGQLLSSGSSIYTYTYIYFFFFLVFSFFKISIDLNVTARLFFSSGVLVSV